MHFDKSYLKSFWSHLMNLTSCYRLHKVYNTIIRRAICLNCFGREMGYNILGREALEKSVVYHLNIIQQFEKIKNNVTGGSSSSNTCYIFGVFAILRYKFTSNENQDGYKDKSNYYNSMFPSGIVHIVLFQTSVSSLGLLGLE